MAISKKRKDNNFSEYTRQLFTYAKECWECGMNGQDCAHHIVHGMEADEFMDSAFNLAPLHNAKCHIANGHHFTEEQTVHYLLKTMRHLYFTGYKMKHEDIIFVHKQIDRYRSTDEGVALLEDYGFTDISTI